MQYSLINLLFLICMIVLAIICYLLLLRLTKHDPLYNCKLFREHGCSHIDGMFCDLKTCTMANAEHKDTLK